MERFMNARDGMAIVGRKAADQPTPAKMVVHGLVVVATLRATDDGARLRIGFEGKGQGWSEYWCDRSAHEHEPSRLADEIVAAIELAMRTTDGVDLRDLDADRNAARAYLYSLAYLAIASWQPAGCGLRVPVLRAFRPPAGVRR